MLDVDCDRAIPLSSRFTLRIAEVMESSCGYLLKQDSLVSSDGCLARLMTCRGAIKVSHMLRMM